MDIKSSTLIEVSNGIYEKLNRYNNVYIPVADALFAEYGINPLDINTAAIPVPQRGLVFARMAEFLTLVGNEAAMRESECALAQAGYMSIDEALDDVGLRFAGSTATAIITNLTALKGALALIDGIVSNEILNTLITDISNVKAAIVSAVPTLNQV